LVREEVEVTNKVFSKLGQTILYLWSCWKGKISTWKVRWRENTKDIECW